MTLKECMRRYIEKCKTSGRLYAASDAERLITKFAELADEAHDELSEEIAQVKGGGVVLYENYDGAPADGVIPCDISTYRYVEVLFVRNTGAGDVHSAVSGIVVGKSFDACANIWIATSPDVIGYVQIRLHYDESANCVSSTAGIYVEYNTTNGMSMTAGPDTYTFPARIVGYK